MESVSFTRKIRDTKRGFYYINLPKRLYGTLEVNKEYVITVSESVKAEVTEEIPKESVENGLERTASV